VGGLGPSQGRNFGLKSGGTKLEAPKAPRIEMPKVPRAMRNGRGDPSRSIMGSGAVVKLYPNCERGHKIWRAIASLKIF